MLPRRGYEPLEGVDDDDEGTGDENKSPSLSGGNNSGRRNRSDYSPIVSPSSDDLTISVPDSDTIISDPNAHNSDSNKRGNPDKIGSDGGFKIRILDVQGQTYSLSVSAGMTVRELKVMLVDVAGVEVARQRIIYGGKLLGDADTLSSRKVFDGAAIHLFQRPKAPAVMIAPGVGIASAQQPGGLGEIPPLMLNVQERGIYSQAEGYLDSHWEVDGPRRGIRFLASILLLFSIMQLLECLASISAAMTSPAEGHRDDSHHPLSSEYWMLVRGRSVSSVLGIVVGVLGVRGSQSLNPQMIRIYYFGLVVCAIMAVFIRIEVLHDVISGKIPFVEYRSNGLTSSSTDESGGGIGGEDESESSSGGTGAGQGERGMPASPQEPDTNLVVITCIASFSVIFSAMVWFLCIRRAGSMRNEIERHLDRRRSLLLMEEARTRLPAFEDLPAELQRALHESVALQTA